MVAKKRPTKQVSKLRLVSSKRSLNGWGVLEPVTCAYFSTVFRVTRRKVAWGNYSRFYDEHVHATLDANDILGNSSEIYVERGETIAVEGETYLVAKGRSHSLLIKIDDWFGETLTLDFHKSPSLTIGSLYSRIKNLVDENSLDSTIYITRQRPTPIVVDDEKNWSLVTSSSGNRGWSFRDYSSPLTSLSVTQPELLLYAFINSPTNTWALGAIEKEGRARYLPARKKKK